MSEMDIYYGKSDVSTYRTYATPLTGITQIPESSFTGRSNTLLAASINVRVLEPAYIDPARQYNLPAMILGVLLVLLGLAIEFYNLRPPVSNRATA